MESSSYRFLLAFRFSHFALPSRCSSLNSLGLRSGERASSPHRPSLACSAGRSTIVPRCFSAARALPAPSASPDATRRRDHPPRVVPHRFSNRPAVTPICPVELFLVAPRAVQACRRSCRSSQGDERRREREIRSARSPYGAIEPHLKSRTSRKAAPCRHCASLRPRARGNSIPVPRHPPVGARHVVPAPRAGRTRQARGSSLSFCSLV